MEAAAALITALAPLVGVVIVAVLLVDNRTSIKRLLETATRVRVGGMIDIELTKEAVASARPEVRVPSERLASVARRLDREAAQLRGFRILWVDDNPAGNATERRILRSVGVHVEVAVSTKEALLHLDRDEFDLIITDIRRGDEPDAGLDMAKQIRARGLPTPIVGYIVTVDPNRPCPPEFRALVVPADELLHQVMDVAARRSEIVLL